DLQPLRVAALGSAVLLDDRHLAAAHGRDHAAADQAEPAAGRPGPGQGHDAPAAHVYLPVRDLPGGARDLLDLEQRALHRAAVGDHEAHGGPGLSPWRRWPSPMPWTTPRSW